jgi:hypothetical protein
MTSKEKAEKLVSDFYSINCKLIEVKNGYDMGDRYDLVFPKSKQCALRAVDEILNNFGSRVGDKTHYCNYMTIQYYLEVKQEIENL